MFQNSLRNRRAVLSQWAAIGVWLGIVCFGFWWLIDYELRGGHIGYVPDVWPNQASLRHSEHTFELVMFIHPRCPCTAASLEELSKLLPRLGADGRSIQRDGVRVHVVVLKPELTDAAFTDTLLVARALDMPGVQLVFDHGGVEAERFGAQTSGHTVLYSPNGRLLFVGGITGTRGHAGDNESAELVVRAFYQKVNASQEAARARVFGCALAEPLCGEGNSKNIGM
ncbi:MAG: RedB protein [Planctomycetaceae bacterium]|nr:RedB protein [Planctomycetaceae bacterium]MBT4887909.1 RedB protein [Planctomycetaceae bacterium]MBT6459691.1 RedB protein [Planctomycetaceae bacterium]MBT6642046.1 RedB protein [Planctomycetaceae bacterium]